MGFCFFQVFFKFYSPILCSYRGFFSSLTVLIAIPVELSQQLLTGILLLLLILLCTYSSIFYFILHSLQHPPCFSCVPPSVDSCRPYHHHQRPCLPLTFFLPGPYRGSLGANRINVLSEIYSGLLYGLTPLGWCHQKVPLVCCGVQGPGLVWFPLVSTLWLNVTSDSRKWGSFAEDLHEAQKANYNYKHYNF